MLGRVSKLYSQTADIEVVLSVKEQRMVNKFTISKTL